MHQRYRLLRLLADGRFHSGGELGLALGMGRSAVWKIVRAIGQDPGLDVHAVRGKGYRLARPLDLLERDKVLRAMAPAQRELLSGLDVLPSVDSTNRYLMQRRDPVPGFACLAEHQRAGRGRRGRSWASPFAANLYLSLRWRFESAPDPLSFLGLAAGVCVSRALQSLGAREVMLKWPNDVQWQRRKLAGILLEMAGEASGPYDVVVGVGVNVHMPAQAGAGIDQPWTDLRAVLGRSVDRNEAAGAVLGALLQGLEAFSLQGFAPFRAEWEARDMVRGQVVSVDTGQGTAHGMALGLDETGALRIASQGRIHRYFSGDVTLRLDS